MRLSMAVANYIIKLILYERRPFNAKDKHAELHGNPEEGRALVSMMPGNSVRGREPSDIVVHS